MQDWTARRSAVRKAVIIASGRGPASWTPAATAALGRSLNALAEAGVRRCVIIGWSGAESARARLEEASPGLDLDFRIADGDEGEAAALSDARAELAQDLILLRSDLAASPEMISRLADGAAQNAVCIDSSASTNPGLCRLNPTWMAENLLPALDRAAAAARLEEILSDAALTHPLTEIPVEGALWMRVEGDLDAEKASYLLAAPSEQATVVESLHGGYWRLPITEHVLLCNIYFPPDAMLRKIAERLPDLVAAYPSGQETIVERISALTGQPTHRLAAGNGVSELICALYEEISPTLAISTPAFDEFRNAAPKGSVKTFTLPPPDFDMEVDLFAEFVIASGADTAVVVNPNNPTGRFVERDAMRRLARRLGDAGRRLLIDESFIDFTDLGAAGSLEPDLEALPNVVILKSLGKIYGVGGVRLGYALSSDRALIDGLRRRLPIWNINSIAEHVLWLLPEFQPALEESRVRMREDRADLHRLLCFIPGMTVVPSQTNYLFCRMPDDWPSGPEVSHWLLREHGVLIRNCAYHVMPEADRYLRLTARTPIENLRLVECLKAVPKIREPRARAAAAI